MISIIIMRYHQIDLHFVISQNRYRGSLNRKEVIILQNMNK